MEKSLIVTYPCSVSISQSKNPHKGEGRESSDLKTIIDKECL